MKPLATLAINFKIDCISVIKFVPEPIMNDWKEFSVEQGKQLCLLRSKGCLHYTESDPGWN